LWCAAVFVDVGNGESSLLGRNGMGKTTLIAPSWP